MIIRSDRYTTGQKALTRNEYERLIGSITDLQDELMIVMGVNTGLRREDLCNIECDNIHMKNKRLRFHEAKKDRRVKDPITHQYTGGIIEKWREIDLSDKLIALVQKFYNTIPKEKLRERKYLFDYVGRTAYRHFQEWCIKANVDTRPIHALRATCIKFANAAGWSDEQIAELTGDTIKTIQEHYRTPSIDEMRNVTNTKPII